MELFILIIVLLILAETTVITVKNIKKPFPSGNQRRRVYVDTSALMDPRLLAVAQTGFIGDNLIVPRSVIHELQLLADGKDHDKRLRARAGLDAVRELERVVYFDMTILDDELDHTPVDNRLLELARTNRGAILTNDYNLEKVAATDHIDTLNLNALALVLRNEHLPGETTKVKIVAVGSGADQGVGYLKDGTMVVVDHASKRVGEEIEIEFVRVNQTAAGTMMFAKPISRPSSQKPSVKSAPSPNKISPKAPSRSQSKPQSAPTSRQTHHTGAQSIRPVSKSRTATKSKLKPPKKAQ